MPKMIATCATHWRGRAIARGEAIDARDDEIAELAAHGFRRADEDANDADKPDDLAALSRKDLLKRLRGKGLGNILVLPTDELRKLAAKIGSETRDD